MPQFRIKILNHKFFPQYKNGLITLWLWTSLLRYSNEEHYYYNPNIPFNYDTKFGNNKITASFKTKEEAKEFIDTFITKTFPKYINYKLTQIDI